ncbi:hypothetical protein [Flammeovirga kamogawensis]|uniref:Ion transporter n=1 Tax=Flammeovirga kamogawensis TaxID=373891 RepID=A0ABX8GRY4_9BACT|nr:hypothetical protein [Flammeovirga kamogawensis]MBB6461446.1 hypothetical protein [Flammeovirga kamogawensis]QWG06340.1 hypothetical protein KM029_13495 [Flammeovirga kamogawensis]TRX68168.1 hypothetical protein EO216_08510 [Flammeovirga kamogawensis]
MRLFFINKKDFDIDKLNTKEERMRLVRDIVVLNIILFQMLWLAFNSLYSTQIFKDFLDLISVDFTRLYGKYIYENFEIVELFFSTFYLLEFFQSWYESYKDKQFAKWYFYPFVYFYDFIGSFPGMHVFRLFRVFALLARWHKLQVINLENLGLVRTALHVKEVVVEEISDAVVINVLESVKDELSSGGYANQKFMSDVVKPYQENLSIWISRKVMHAMQETYSNRQQVLEQYVSVLIEDAVKNNDEMKDIKKVPIVGDYASSRLEDAISDIVYKVINDLFEDIASERNEEVLKEVVYEIMEGMLFSKTKDENGKLVQELGSTILDAVISRVSVKQWQMREKMWEDEKQKDLEEKRKHREQMTQQNQMQSKDSMK